MAEKCNKTENNKKQIIKNVETAQMLDGIVFMHPSVERIKHPIHGFALRWVDQMQMQKKKKWWNNWIPHLKKREHILKLDELGLRTVELIDGKNDLKTIAQTIAHEFSMDEEQTTAALITFIIMLQRKNIIRFVTS